MAASLNRLLVPNFAGAQATALHRLAAQSKRYHRDEYSSVAQAVSSTATPLESFSAQVAPFDHTASVRYPELVDTVRSCIRSLQPDLASISSSIHARPELKWEEHYAHDILTDYMEKNGFSVERHSCGLATAWSAHFAHGGANEAHVTIGFNSEMDALPGIGHACGHNLIAISGCAAAIAVAQALQNHDISGRVILLGTPAEEGGGGKVVMLEKGAYEGMDACLMLHPGSGQPGGEIPSTNAKSLLEVEYFGREAHAAVKPQAGINALDAANIAYMSINALRQQVDDEARIHGIMGGEAHWVQNIIPAYAKLTYGIRHTDKEKKDALVKRVQRCFEAAATATGCTCKISQGFAYENLKNNDLLSKSYKEISESLYNRQGRPYVVTLGTRIGGSTDFGNVTHKLPACHPVFFLPQSSAEPHTASFADSAGSPEAVEPTMQAATALALVGLRVVLDKEHRNGVKAEFRRTVTGAASEDSGGKE